MREREEIHEHRQQHGDLGLPFSLQAKEGQEYPQARRDADSNGEAVKPFRNREPHHPTAEQEEESQEHASAHLQPSPVDRREVVAKDVYPTPEQEESRELVESRPQPRCAVSPRRVRVA